MIQVFDRIVSEKNISAAYLNLTEQMEADGRSARYRGWDGLKIRDLETSSYEIISEARDELIRFIPLAPAVASFVPKKRNPSKLREIFTYRLKDRIKAQAIYQVIEPYFDAFLSPWLFSYRSSHLSYQAARSVVRHYRRYFNRDEVLVADVSDYTKNIRKDILVEKIRELGFDEKTLRLINLFIDNTSWKDGKISKPDSGLVSGTPLISLFYNIYLDSFDKFCGPQVDFYRRVGDDLIMFDKQSERLDLVQQRLLEETEKLGIAIHSKKSRRGPATMPFTYLGYRFENGTVGFSSSFWRSAIKSWQEQFNSHKMQNERKKRRVIKNAINRQENNLKDQFRQIAEQKKLVNDPQQIRDFSEDFFKALTRFFFGSYTARNRRLLKDKLLGLGIVSPYRYFWARKYSYGKNKK